MKSLSIGHLWLSFKCPCGQRMLMLPAIALKATIVLSCVCGVKYEFDCWIEDRNRNVIAGYRPKEISRLLLKSCN